MNDRRIYEFNDVVRITNESLKWNVISYNIYGLNIFDCFRFPELRDLCLLPYLKFLMQLMEPYETICLVGSPALQEWFDDLHYKQHLKIAIDTTIPVVPEQLIGEGIHYTMLSICFHEGRFWKISYSGKSLLCKLPAPQILLKLLTLFMGSDSVAFFLYEKGKDALAVTREVVECLEPDNILESPILGKATLFLTSQNEGESFEIFAQNTSVEAQIRTACQKSVEYIVSTDWFMKHKELLYWNNLTNCCTVREA